MPVKRQTVRLLGVAAMLAMALGFGFVLGAPDTAVAQEDTTTTVVEDDSSETTTPESTDESESNESRARDHDCGERDGGSSSEESTTGDL